MSMIPYLFDVVNACEILMRVLWNFNESISNNWDLRVEFYLVSKVY